MLLKISLKIISLNDASLSDDAIETYLQTILLDSLATLAKKAFISGEEAYYFNAYVTAKSLLPYMEAFSHLMQMLFATTLGGIHQGITLLME